MLIAFLLGLAFGAALMFWRSKKPAARAARRVPREWPLKARPLLNSTERQVWGWLAKVMFDQHIMVKLPVTRFTLPQVQGEARQWFELLHGIYCTFTVCGSDGRVLGCVDVAGAKVLSMRNQTLKHALLTQCGIKYWVVELDNLPHRTQLRTAFLGEWAARADQIREADSKPTSGGKRPTAAAAASVDMDAGREAESMDSRLSSIWSQDSFMAGLDSRSAELKP